MLDAVFISDLHLNSCEPQLISRFDAFIAWALDNTRAVYVLGDLFHVWAGDDCVDAWSLAIAHQFQHLAGRGIQLYFMPGNRDFLLGSSFAKQAGFQLLHDPTVITLDGQSILLAHGDAYCILDKAHQRFRCLTRNAWFMSFFLSIPAKWRARLVGKVRAQSQRNRNKSPLVWDVVPKALIKDMRCYHLHTLIHGHIHKPGLRQHQRDDGNYRQFVLSDWDDTPQILIYNKTTGFEFIQPIA
ncbi:MAG: UDP-2,3-diacylglucosamine diphosphatase [Legionellales bacterium RIFCSPHIGHO2_12_FULL_42_9]|nr:MAG: UDP-2,3-diacylglucosamine diphosphatase [Legionellales bacterium RIFCSPHIGHO2_12_FULL_42_9]